MWRFQDTKLNDLDNSGCYFANMTLFNEIYKKGRGVYTDPIVKYERFRKVDADNPDSGILPAIWSVCM